MTQEFWGRWHRVYLPTLIPHKKWNFPRENFKVGDLVLLKEFNIVKNQWSRGRVNKVLPNQDGKVRCLEIRRPDGVLLFRDVGSICKLEVDLCE